MSIIVYSSCQAIDASYLMFDFVPESLATALDTMERFAQEVRPGLSQ